MSNLTTLFHAPLAATAVASLPVPALAALTVFIGLPVVAIVLNVAWQLVRFSSFLLCVRSLLFHS
jgi:hypothetical protein